MMSYRLLFVLMCAAVLIAGSLPATAQSLSVYSGDGQLVLEEFRSTSPLVVVARDAQGHPVPDAEVDFTIFEGDGGLTTPEAVTDSDGLASTYYVATSFETAQSIKTVRVRATSPQGTAEFVLTISIIRIPGGAPAPPPAVFILKPKIVDPPFEGETGETIPEAVQALVTVQSGIQVGDPVPNIGMRIVNADDFTEPVPVSCDGPNGVAFSGADGIVKCDLNLGTQPGTYRLAAYVGEAAFSYMFRVIVTGDDPDPGEPSGPDPLAITTNATLPTAMVGGSYAVNFSASGGQEPYSWRETGILPDGLTMNRQTGVLSGTPATAGTAQFTVSVTDATDTTVSRNFVLTVNDPQVPAGSFIISSSSFPNGVIDDEYAASVITSGGCVSPFNPPTFSVAAGALPPGLNLVSGVIRGTPTQAGTFQFTLSARDACGAQAQRLFVLTVLTSDGQEPPPSIDASPSALTFDVQSGSGVAPGAQTVALSVAGSEPFTATATTFSGGPWLQVAPSSGTAPSSIQVSVANTAGLAAGAYQGEVTVIPTQSGAGPTRIGVTLVATEGPLLQVSPGTLKFVVKQGAPPPTQQAIAVTSPVGGQVFQLDVETETGGNWLFATPAGITTPANVFVAVSPYFMDPGIYKGTVTVKSGDEVETINVVLDIEQPKPVITAVTNAATFLEGAVAPGELVVIFGRNLGPTELVTLEVDANGKLKRDLQSVKVFFGLTAAPVVYASARQVSAIVPYSVAGRSSMKMRLAYRDAASAEVDIAIAPASPGIFTLDATGQGAILNQDGSVNSRANPAAAGTIIAIYATGAGVMNPAAADGLIIPGTMEPLPAPVLPVVVEIDGKTATQHYAGAAPVLPNGMIQVNATIPEDLEPGVYDVVIRIGEYASPTGVTVAVE